MRGMERFLKNDFTVDEYSGCLTEPLPDADGFLNLDIEAARVKVWETNNGFEYHLPYGDLARIQLWKDGKVMRLAVAEKIDGTWPVYREPTLREMVNFVRVAQYALPDSFLTDDLTIEVKQRIFKQADTAEMRGILLRRLGFYLRLY